MIEQRLYYGDSAIDYKVCHVPGRVRKLAIHVHPDGSVQVDAPPEISLQAVRQAVTRRARWIADHLHSIALRRAHVLPREYVSGESHFYLGRRYVLKLKGRRQKDPAVRLIRGRFEITGDELHPDRVRSLMWDWYKVHARGQFERRLEQLWPDLPWVDARPHWKLLTMKKQWGSCSPGGVLSLNPHLVKAPSECIDYVLLHELCHVKVHNHSPAFYKLMSRYMPHWEAVKGRLDGMAELLLNT